MTCVLEARGLCYRYPDGREALCGLDLTVSHGERVAVLGPNGAGKTTLVEMLTGFVAPTSGTVRVLGEDPRRASRWWRSRVGMVCQSTALDPQLTVGEMLAAIAAAYPDPLLAGEALSLVGLTGDSPSIPGAYRDDPYASVSAKVKAVASLYGIYDMVQQWEHDQLTRPRDQITEKFLGGPPMASRRRYFDASPLSYATIDKNSPRFLLVWGREDDIVDPATQSERFLSALKQAGFFVRTIVVPGAGHFWCSEPLDEPHGFGAYTAPKLLRCLDATL